MTVNTAQLQPEKKNCNGSTVTFSFDTVIQAPSQAVLQLYEVATGVYTALSRPADFDVTAFGPNGTTIVTTATYASGFQLVLTRNIDRSQQSKWTYNDDFDGPALEAELDRQALVSQTQDAELYRAAKVQVGVDVPAGGLILPAPEDGKVLVGRADGLGWEHVLLSVLDPVLVDALPLSIANGGTGGTTAAAARAALAVAGLAANSFTGKQTHAVGSDFIGADATPIDHVMQTEATANDTVIGRWTFKAKDAGDDVYRSYVVIEAFILDNTDDTPDGGLNIYTISNGVVTRQMRIITGGVGLGPSLGGLAQGTINAVGYYLNGVLQTFGGLTLIEAEKVGDGTTTQAFSWPIAADARVIRLEIDELGTTLEANLQLLLEFSENDGGAYWDGSLSGGEVATSVQGRAVDGGVSGPDANADWDANFLHRDETDLCDARPGLSGTLFIRNARDATRPMVVEGVLHGIKADGAPVRYDVHKVLANTAKVFDRFRLRINTVSGGTKFFPTWTRARAYKVS